MPRRRLTRFGIDLISRHGRRRPAVHGFLGSGGMPGLAWPELSDGRADPGHDWDKMKAK
jgi:hypothetical protein